MQDYTCLHEGDVRRHLKYPDEMPRVSENLNAACMSLGMQEWFGRIDFPKISYVYNNAFGTHFLVLIVAFSLYNLYRMLRQ
jgi:hypothetical protein